jgi:hypothetical protein
VAAELTQHSWDGEGGEVDPVLGIEPLHGTEHAELRHLQEIGHRHTSADEALAAVHRHPSVADDELVAHVAVARTGVLLEERCGVVRLRVVVAGLAPLSAVRVRLRHAGIATHVSTFSPRGGQQILTLGDGVRAAAGS